MHKKKSLPSAGDPAMQNPYQLECKKKQLSAFIHGLRSSISTAVQLLAPKSAEVKVKQSHYRPGQAQRVLRKLRFLRFHANGTGWW